MVHFVDKIQAWTEPASNEEFFFSQKFILSQTSSKSASTKGQFSLKAWSLRLITATISSSSRQAATKTPTQSVVCRCDTAQRGVGSDHTAGIRTQPSRRIRSFCFEWIESLRGFARQRFVFLWTAEAFHKNIVSLECISITKRPTEFSIPRVATKLLSVFAIICATRTPACHHV